jgi:hypothetical protein
VEKFLGVLTGNRDLLPELLVEPEGLETETVPGAKVELAPSDDPLLSLFRSDAAVTPDTFHEELRKQRAGSSSAHAAAAHASA